MILQLDANTSKYFSEVAPEYIRSLLELPFFGAIGAFDVFSAQPVGILLFEERTGEELYIRWFYVLEKFRYKGNGEQLLAHFCRMAGQNGYKKISVVFSEVIGEKEYLSRFEDYFTEKGFTRRQELPSSYMVNGEKFLSLPFVTSGDDQVLEEVMPFCKISKAAYNEFMQTKEFSPILNTNFDKELSCGIFRGNKLSGLLFVLKGGEYYMPVGVVAYSKKDARKLLLYTVGKIAEQITQDDFVAAISLSENSQDVFQMIFDGEEGYEVYALEADTEVLLKDLGDSVEKEGK